MDANVFQNRRRALLELIGDGIAVIPTATEHMRNRDVLFPFRADSDFYYLSGFAEPDAVVVLAPQRTEGEYILFCRESDSEKEMWDGNRAGTEGALRKYQADQAFAITELDAVLPGILAGREKLFYSNGRYPAFDARLIACLENLRTQQRSGIHAPHDMIDLGHVLHELRLLKQTEEIKIMKRAAAITAKAHRRAMRCCTPGMMEYQLQAEVERVFKHHGASGPAYSSIVAGGGNGCILHYINNNCRLADGDMVLIDAGAEVDYYAADITRTFPVNGTFTSAQRDVYEIVLAAQHEAFNHVRAGLSIKEYDDAAIAVLTRGLVDLRLLKGNVPGLIEQRAYQRFYMHRTGHYLGMDVHDVGDYKINNAWRTLKPGMVLTVEPGLYIRAADDIPAHFHNVAVRIEDNLLVTENGYEMLTADVPSTTDNIETLMSNVANTS